MKEVSTSNIYITPVRSRRELRLFLEIPLLLHADEPLWVPIPIFMEKDQLDQTRNPCWKHTERELFLAFREDRPVGRVAAILDRHLDVAAGQRVGAWGYFACADDAEAAAALFQAVEAWHGARPEGKPVFLRGPLNPSLNYTAGMLVEGFERFPSFMNPYNPPYYPLLVTACGMEKEQDLFFYRFSRADNLDICRRELDRAFTRNSEFTLRRSTRASYDDDMRLLSELYTRCWADNWGFTPLSAEEIGHSWSVMRYLPVMAEMLFIEHRGEAVGMALIGADLGRLMKRLNGRLSPATPWHVYKGLGEVKGARLYMLGVTREYRRGIATFLLLHEAISIAADAIRLDYVDAGWILEDNANMNRICERLQGERLTCSRIYRRECARV